MASYAVHSTRQVANNAESCTPMLQPHHYQRIIDTPVGGNNGYRLRTASISPIPPLRAPAPHRIAPADEVGSVRSLERTDHHSHQYRIGSRTAEGIHKWRVVRTFFGVTRHASSESLRQFTNNFCAVGASSKICFDYDSHGDSQVQGIVRATQLLAVTPCYGLG